METTDIAKRFTDQLYASSIPLLDSQGQTITLEGKGFLGLLAIGWRGIVALRQSSGETHLFEKYSKNKKAVIQRRRKPKTRKPLKKQ